MGSGVWGIACNDCYYPSREFVQKNNGSSSTKLPDLEPFRGDIFDVDIMWNADEHTLQMMVVGSKETNQVTFRNVGGDSSPCFLPHINSYSCENNNWDAAGS